LMLVIALGIGVKLYDWGHDTARADCDNEQSAALMGAVKQIAELQEKNRLQQQQITVTADAMERTLKDETTKRDTIITDLRNNVISLRDKYARAPVACDLPAAAPGSGVGDATPGCRLSQQTSEYLVSEAARADEVANQLAACQKILRADRLQWN